MKFPLIPQKNSVKSRVKRCVTGPVNSRLHSLRRRVIPSLTVALLHLGCLKQPSTQIDYGPEVPPQEVIAALKEHLGENDTPHLIQVEESVLRESTRLIRGRSLIEVLSRSEVTVVEKKETPTQWHIKEVEKLQKYDPSDASKNPPPLVREDHKCWNKTTLERELCDISDLIIMNLAPSKTPARRELLTPLSAFQTQQQDRRGQPITYHNLRITHQVGDPPRAVKESPECRRLVGCQIRTTKIEFDRINWEQDPEGALIHYSLTTSLDVPPMARLMESCQQGSIQVIQKGQDPKTAPRFLVSFCETVKDFIFGQPL